MKKLLIIFLILFSYSTVNASSEFCNDGYQKVGKHCIKKPTIPPNAYAVGSFWKCKSGYRKSRNHCVKLPANAFAFGPDNWQCHAGYIQSGETCIKSNNNNIPDNGKCNSGYYKYFNYCHRLPSNAYALTEGFNCNSGYKKVLGECKKTSSKLYIPPNAYASGTSWKCNYGYYRDYQNCRKLPPNGVARYDGEDFSDGKGLDCESGYEKNQFKRCGEKSVDDDKVYSAASGSGFAVTSDGYVITNYHVIEGCTDVKIHDKGKSILATLVTFDPNNDIALLKGDFKPRSFYPLSRKTPQLLMDIYAAGYPFGQDMSTSVKVTQGIISSLTGVANNFSNLQISAALQPGNSGGPIVNEKGNVIGVAVAKLDLEKIVDDYGVVPENVNFGVKSNLVINILESENIKLPSPNTKTIPKSELVEMITDGTYYLSCWMTLAQIKQMIETKVMFKDLK